MPDGLIVSGGGTTTVVTEELEGAAVQLEALTRESAALASDVSSVNRVLSWSELAGAPADAFRAEADLGRAVVFLRQAELQARFFSWALSQAADGYHAVEFGTRQLLGGLVDGIGGVIGMLAPAFLPGAALTVGGIAALSPDDRNRLMSDPGVVGAVRAGVMGVDDAIMGRMGIPRPIAELVGDQGLGALGVPWAAASVGLLGSAVGAFRGGDARVAREVPLVTTAPPVGFVDRLDRVPRPEDLGGAQIVIEQYEMPDGSVRAEVYLAGTVDFDPWAEGEPWDMASNIENAVGPGSGSFDAALAAMEQAGIQPETPVQFTGYSQGGATAARLVESGLFNAEGLVTFGGPTGQIALPEGVPTVIVEHTDDMVAALGGAQHNTHAVIVERYATEGMDFAGSELMPGHRLPGYLETAGLMDASAEPALADAARTIDGFTDGGVLVSRTAYETERISGAS